jgi:hypothetical protein
MLQQILNKYTEIGILPELHLYWPKILHKDLATIYKKRFGRRISDNDINELIRLMYSKKLKGIFWKNIHKFNIDIEELKLLIEKSDRTLKGILDSLFMTLKSGFHKEIMGAKFPVHFSFANVLLEWYPQCKLIHTIRDPRAIFVSQYYKYKTDNGVFRNILVSVPQFLHVNYSLRKVYDFHKLYKYNKNYFIYKYEDVVVNPEKQFKTLCGFLGIKFRDEMINPQIYYNTSFTKKEESIGIHKYSMKSWENMLSPTVAKTIKLLNWRYMKEFGYC